jgi:hypothetical protein
VIFFVLAKQNRRKINIDNFLVVNLGHSLSSKYLGVPIHFRKLKSGEWKLVEDHFERKLSSWIGYLLSYDDRLILINLELRLTYLCSFYHFLRYLKRHERDIYVLMEL